MQGNNLRAGDETVLSKFDIVVLQRFNYDDIRGGTYSAIKKINPNTKIFLYQLGPWCATKDDGPTAGYMRSIGRYNNNKGHSMGNLNTDNSDFFLLDANSKKINVPAFPNDYLLDFGSKKLIDYWIEATTNDIIGQAWEADGLFLDVTVPIISPYLSGAPTAYPTNSSWTAAMNNFINSIANNYSGINLIGANYGSSAFDDGYAAWKMLDNIAAPPYFALEEGAFVTWYGSDANFFTKDQWKSQLNTLNEIKNYNVFFQSDTKLNPGETGTDNYNKNLTFWDALWFAVTSFKLGQHDNSYFGFQHNSKAGNFSNMPYFDEFDINIGRAIGDYQTKTINGNEIFMREFENGYVYVNPNNAAFSDIMLPGLGRQLSHDNFLSDISSLPIINSIELLPHRGTIIMKAAPDRTKPTIVNFSILDNSISLTVPVLTFTAVDNVGVTGYLITESATTPNVNDAGWKATAPNSYTFSSLGTKTLYAWTKNAAGKVSASVSTKVVIQKGLGCTEVYANKITFGARAAMPVTFAEPGVINSVSIYHEGGTGGVILGVYSDQDGSPSSRLGVTASTTINSKAGWQTVSLTSPVTVTSGQTLWLSWVFQYNTVIRYTAGAPSWKYTSSYWSTGMPATFGTSNTNNNKFSVYCNYN
ncbi:hypothetical protein MASR2M47_21180 [Draconibacterium sp.]